MKAADRKLIERAKRLPAEWVVGLFSRASSEEARGELENIALQKYRRDCERF